MENINNYHMHSLWLLENTFEGKKKEKTLYFQLVACSQNMIQNYTKKTEKLPPKIETPNTVA